MKLERYEVKFPVDCGYCHKTSHIIIDCRKVFESLPILETLTKALKDIREHDLYCGVNSCGHNQIDVMASNALYEIEKFKIGHQPVKGKP